VLLGKNIKFSSLLLSGGVVIPHSLTTGERQALWMYPVFESVKGS
jgi:hypothetical protein